MVAPPETGGLRCLVLLEVLMFCSWRQHLVRTVVEELKERR